MFDIFVLIFLLKCCCFVESNVCQRWWHC